MSTIYFYNVIFSAAILFIPIVIKIKIEKTSVTISFTGAESHIPFVSKIIGHKYNKVLIKMIPLRTLKTAEIRASSIAVSMHL